MQNLMAVDSFLLMSQVLMDIELMLSEEIKSFKLESIG
jgi:hypothetical protein